MTVYRITYNKPHTVGNAVTHVVAASEEQAKKQFELSAKIIDVQPINWEVAIRK